MVETKCEELKAEQISAAQKGCRVHTINATIKMAAQASGDLIKIGTIKKGERFLYGVISTTHSLSTATIAIGTTADDGKYKTAAVFTSTNTPTLFGATLAQDVNSADEDIYVKVGTAALPAAGTGKEIKVSLFVSVNN